MADGDDEDTFDIPLVNQRYFGAGLKLKKVNFVPASTPSATTSATYSGLEIAERYLAIVCPTGGVDESLSTSAISAFEPETKICDICKAPINTASATPHEATIVHQISLETTQTPSAIDRTRKGLTYLEKHGWDPDSGKGLGVTGDGMLHPLKPTAKRDTVGLGIKVKNQSVIKPKPVRLHAGQVRKLEKEDKKKHQKLHDLFYKDDDVLKHLGGLENRSHDVVKRLGGLR